MVFELCKRIRQTDSQTDKQTDRQTDGNILHYTLHPLSRAKVVVNSEAVKAIKGDICKGAFI